MGIDNYILAWSLNLKQTLENANCVWKQRRAASPRQRVGIDNYILAWSLNMKQTLENANNQVGKHNSLKGLN